MTLPFGEFTPDLPALNSSGTPYVKNVIPALKSYLPFPSFSVVSVDSTTARPQGGFAGKESDSTVFVVLGDTTKLYQLSGVNLTDVSRLAGGAYACAADDMWNFVQFDTRVIAVNIADDIQSINVDTETDFTKHVTSTLEPKAKYIAIIGEFPVIAYTKESSVSYPKRVRWPSINNSKDFDESATNQSDHQDLLDGGVITGIVGYKKYGVVITEDSLHRMDYVGGAIIFDFEKIEGSKGSQIPSSITASGRDVFYYSPEGFFRFNGMESVPIGTEKIDTFFKDDLDFNYRHRIRSASDPERKLYIIAYPGAGNVSGRPNKILIYRWDINRWSYAETTVELLFRSFSQGFTLEQLDNISASLDGLDASLDSSAYAGGRLMLAGCDGDFKVGTFSGAALDAIIDTAEIYPMPGFFTYIDSVIPLVDGLDATVITVEDLTRDIQSQKNPTENGENAAQANGRSFVDKSAVFHRFRVRISGGFKHAIGIDGVQDAISDGAI